MEQTEIWEHPERSSHYKGNSDSNSSWSFFRGEHSKRGRTSQEIQ